MKWLVIIVTVASLAVIFEVGRRKTMEAHDFAADSIRYLHVKILVSEYVREEGVFPPNLKVLLKDYDYEQFVRSEPDEEWIYCPPQESDPTNTVVLVISLRNKNVVIDKAFELKSVPK
ncbi:MAG: hypothetical protein ACO1QB_12835 [Verrucomicrobiales bacterium]